MKQTFISDSSARTSAKPGSRQTTNSCQEDRKNSRLINIAMETGFTKLFKGLLNIFLANFNVWRPYLFHSLKKTC